MEVILVHLGVLEVEEAALAEDLVVVLVVEWEEVLVGEVHQEAGNELLKTLIMGKRFKFSEEQKSEIEKAVKNLEAKTSGEMVSYIVPGSDIYVEGTLYTIILSPSSPESISLDGRFACSSNLYPEE